MSIDYKAKLKDSVKHFQTGLKYMLPVIMIGALGKAVPALFGQGTEATNPILAAFLAAGNQGMALFIPVMAAYLAYAIADTPGIAPGLIVGVLAYAGGGGYIGGIVGGFVAGYIIYTIMEFTEKIPENFKSAWVNIMPSLGGLIAAFLIVEFFNPPIKALMDAATNWLMNMQESSLGILGAVVGGIAGVDFGGPLGQAKFAFSLAALGQGFNIPMAVCGVSATVPPLGMCLATYFSPRLYSDEMRAYGKTSIAYTLIGGWTEIAIPFVVDDWFNVTIACTVGSAIAGAIAGLVGLTIPAPGLGVLYVALFNKWWGYFLALGVGALVTAFLVNVLKTIRAKKV